MALRETTVKNGALKGAPSGDPATTVFRGIPYAKPPVGELRWKPPQPCGDWEGVYLAHSFAPVCCQPLMPEVLNHENLEYPEPMSEDCLYLNVWTPAKSREERLPVLLWIHGGAFFAGHSYGTNVDGDYFARKGVILVSVAYRLGVFGFFGHAALSRESETGACGNYGLMDQLLALKWVHENIAAFGGDPERITLAGQSAGSSSVQALISSPLTRGLGVRGAVMISGVGTVNAEFIAPAPQSELEDFGQRLFDALGIHSLSEARAIDAPTFFARAWSATQTLAGPYGMPYKPVVDGYVLPKAPSACARDGDLLDISYMVGHTDEGQLDPAATTMAAYQDWLRDRYGPEADQMAQRFGVQDEAQLAALRPESIRGGLVVASHAFCRRMEELGRKPAYYYYFHHKLPGDEMGAFHGGDLWYFFNKLNRCWRPFTGFDHVLASACADYLCNFVATGDPNGDGLPHWSPDTRALPSVMQLGNPIYCKHEAENPGVEYRICAGI